MVCQDVERNELVTKYLCGQLESDIQDDFELHLLECRSCQSSVEALLAARDDLVARAHEIRSYSPAPSVRLRWVWVGTAALSLVLCSLGLSWYASHQRKGPEVAHQKSPAANTEAPGRNAQTRPLESLPTISHASDTSPRKPGSAAGADQTDSQGNRGAGAKSRLSSPPGRGVTVVTVEEAPVELAPGPLQPSTKGAEENIALLPTITRTNTDGWSDEKLKVLARLSEVTPPAYTFSGIAGSKSLSPLRLFPPSALKQPRGEPRLPGNAQSLFQDGMLAYVEKRYGDAEVLLSEAHKLAVGADGINFYLGICKLMNEKANEAAPFLSSVSRSDTAGKDRKTPYTQAAHFYLGKAYLQEGFLESAETEFEKAAALPGPLQTNAQSIVTELQGLLATAEQEKAEKVNKPN